MAKKKKKHHHRPHGQGQPKRSTVDVKNNPVSRMAQLEKSMQDIRRLTPYMERAAEVAKRERVKKALEQGARV